MESREYTSRYLGGYYTGDYVSFAAKSFRTVMDIGGLLVPSYNGEQLIKGSTSY